MLKPRSLLSIVLTLVYLLAAISARPARALDSQVVYLPLLFAEPAVTLRFTIDRSAVPALSYNDLTLKFYAGSPTEISASADGKPVAVKYDPASGYATLTTNATAVDVLLSGQADNPAIGAFTKTALKEDKAWAWSHSFDDNVMFEEHAIPAFDQYGWRATVYLIGEKISDTREEDWIIDRPDIIRLAQKGWGIGNHSWSHHNVSALGGPEAAKEDVIRLADYLRAAVNAAGLPNRRLIAFAAPNFDSAYLPVINDLRSTHTTELLFDESGDQAVMRVDAGAPGDVYPAFDAEDAIGRDWRIDEYGSGSAYDLAFRQNLAAMLARLDASHHYWLNTFAHGVDDKYPNRSIFAFLPWIYANYGPGGRNTVWVAPAEEIYSYLIVRDTVVLRMEKVK